jgi:nitroreductase
MDVIDAIHSRRSIRSYQPNPVDHDLIESVIWDAAQAPPPFNGQVPWTFNVVEGVERVAALGARAMGHARATRPNSASRLWLDRPGFQIFWNAPVLILISGELEDCCRGSEPDAVGSCPRLGNLLGWFAAALAENRGGEGRVASSGCADAECRDVPGLC